MLIRIRDFRVGVRLAAAFGLIAVLLIVIVGVGVTGASSQRGAQDRIIQATDLRRDVRQMKYFAAVANGSQTAYAHDAARDGASALADSAVNRRQFLDAVQGFEETHESFAADRLTAAESDLAVAFHADFVQFMKNEAEIATLYRSGIATDADKATELVFGAEVDLFYRMAAQADALLKLLQVDVTHANQLATDAAATTRRLMLGFGFVSVALAGALALVIARSLTRPLRESVEVLEAMAGGDLRPRVALPSKDEVGRMGTAMNHSLDRIGQTLDGISDGSTSLSSSLSSSSQELSAVSQQLSAASEQTAAQAASVSAAAEQVSHNVQSAAAGAEELGTSIRKIAKNTSDAARVATEAVTVAEATNDTVTKLA